MFQGRTQSYTFYVLKTSIPPLLLLPFYFYSNLTSPSCIYQYFSCNIIKPLNANLLSNLLFFCCCKSKFALNIIIFSHFHIPYRYLCLCQHVLHVCWGLRKSLDRDLYGPCYMMLKFMLHDSYVFAFCALCN